MPTPHTVRDLDDELLDHAPRRGGHPFLDPVLLLTELGRGGMAAVHLGYHANLHDWVAVKIRRPLDRKDAERFQAEARKLSALRTAGFVQVMDVRPTRDLFYIVMEFVNGEDLRKRWLRRAKARRPIAIAEAVLLIQAAALAVAAAHRQGVVHRDLKPENIMISATGDVRVADLGIARGGGDTGMTMERSIMGTPGYMAPELFRSAKNATPASDVFALAVTLAYLLTGKSLLVPTDFEDLAEAEAKARAFPELLPLVAGLPVELAQLLREATHPRPEERIRDAEQFVARLRPIAEALPATTLADPEACRFSPEQLGELRVRAGRALAEEVQLVTPEPAPTPGPTPTPIGTTPMTVPERPRWPQLAGAFVALAAIGALGAVWAGGRSPELRLRIDGAAVSTDQPIDVREDSTVTLEAECTEPGLFCRWERVRGRDVPLTGGSQIDLRLPPLAAAESITLAALVDVADGPPIRREVTLVIAAEDDPPMLAELTIADVGGDPRAVVLQATDDGEGLNYELTSDQPAGLAVESVGGGAFRLVRGNVPPEGAIIRVKARAIDSRQQSVERTVDVRVLGVPVAPVVVQPACQIAVLREVVLEPGQATPISIAVTPADAEIEPDVTHSHVRVTRVAAGFRIAADTDAPPGDVAVRWIARRQGFRENHAETVVRVVVRFRPDADPVPPPPIDGAVPEVPKTDPAAGKPSPTESKAPVAEAKPAPATPEPVVAEAFYLDVQGYDGSEVELAAFLAAGTGQKIVTDKDKAGLVLELRVVFANQRAVLKGRVCDAAGKELSKARSLGMVGDGTNANRAEALIVPWRLLETSVTANRLTTPQKWKALQALLDEARAKAGNSR